MTIYDVDSLLEQAVQLINRHFDAVYTAIFLLDETGAWLILRAASSMAGRRLVEQGFRLSRNDQSVIARVAETQRPHIASATSDVALDAAHFATNPDSSTARSAAVLPLLVAGELVGVLDIQAEETDFDQDDVRTLGGMAWQLAIAFDTARRLSTGVSILESTSPFYRLAARLGATRVEADAYAAMLEIVQGFNPEHAYIVQPAHEVDPIYLVADLRGGQMNVQRVVGNEVEDLAPHHLGGFEHLCNLRYCNSSAPPFRLSLFLRT